MLKLKLQSFGHLMQRADSFEKTLMLGKIEGRRRRELQRMRWLDGINDTMDMDWWWTGRPGVMRFMGSQRVGTTEWLNWTELDSFGCYKPLTLFQTSDTVDSDSVCIFQCFCQRLRVWRCLLHYFSRVTYTIVFAVCFWVHKQSWYNIKRDGKWC